MHLFSFIFSYTLTFVQTQIQYKCYSCDSQVLWLIYIFCSKFRKELVDAVNTMRDLIDSIGDFPKELQEELDQKDYIPIDETTSASSKTHKSASSIVSKPSREAH